MLNKTKTGYFLKGKKMKRSLINMIIFVVLLTGMLIAGVQISRAAIGSNVWTVNYNDIDPNEPEPEPETVFR